MKTLRLTIGLVFVVLGFALFTLGGCTTQEWKCPNAPKLVANFSIGEHVVFKRKILVRVSEYQFDVEVGDTGVVTDIEYVQDDMWGQMIRYCVRLDKGGDKNWEAHAFQTQTEDHVWDGWIEALPPIERSFDLGQLNDCPEKGYNLHVGDKLAFTKNIAFIDANKGDVVTVIGFMSIGNGINEWGVRVSLDKSGLTFLTNDMDLFEAVVYPDPALAPRK